MAKKRLLLGFLVLIMIGLMEACNGKRPSTENNGANCSDEQPEKTENENTGDIVNVADTVGLDAWLKVMDGFTAAPKDVHITTIADTIQLAEGSELYGRVEAWKSLLSDDPSVDFEEATHSERVKVYQSYMALMEEFLRIDDEMKTVGVSPQSRLMWDGDEKEKLLALKEAMQKELTKELN